MKGNYQEVKTSVYAGMSIFSLIKDTEISIGEGIMSLEDKKYLSLYLGLINTKNTISDYLKSKNVNISTFINYSFLNNEEYLKIYNTYFVDILDEINFESIESHFDYLLSKEVVKSFNRNYGYHIDKEVDNSNKQLIKTIN